ncbi:MAG: flagellar hook-length control protein FliK [Desulfohalobiaceae bacterium]|nr:flagellar hook-length control protein FliK [Desulfohalobiaceae bacterium]
MYISAQPPPVLTLAVPAENSMHRGTESGPLKLAPYQIVRATVAEGGQERVVLNLKQRQLTAETRVPLKPGQKLHLQVLSTKPQIHLRIMEEAELKHLFRTLHSLGRDLDLLPLLKQIQANTDVFSTARGGLPAETQAVLAELIQLFQASPSVLTGTHLARLWNSLGLDLEALLARGQGAEAGSGLKSALLFLAEAARHKDQETGNIQNILEQLKLFQLCRHRLWQENVLFLPLPFPFLEQGYLLAEQDRPRDDESEKQEMSWKMTLNLRLSFLGNLQIKLLIEGQTLRLRILCESSEKAEILRRRIPGLQETLSTVSLHSCFVDTGAEDPITSLVKRLAPDGDHFLEAEA